MGNELVSYSGAATAGYVYDGDGKRVQETHAYVNLAAGIVATGSSTITNPDVVTNGDTWANSGASTSRQYGVISTGLQYVQIDLGSVYRVDKVIVWHYNQDGRTYHNTKIEVSADCSNWTTVFDSAASGEYAENWQGKTVTFAERDVRCVRDWLNGSTANDYNHWTEIQVWGRATVAYLGNYFEWHTNAASGAGNPKTMVRYYYAGAQRIAVRHSNGGPTDGLVFLLSDHLGSSDKTIDPLNNTYNNVPNVLTETRYKAWGEIRYASGSTPTTFRFTGQREQSEIGLYYYGARWYDSALGRFVSADTIVPVASQGTQAFDRYAYVNNNPVRFNDPSGHRLCDGEKDCQYFVNSRIKVYYGITLTGNWSIRDRRYLLGALDNLNEGLGGINQFTAGTTYSFTLNANYYGGRAAGGNIAFHGGTSGARIPYQNYYHEVAHAIDQQSGGYFTRALNASNVNAPDGTYVMGGPASSYQRNSSGYVAQRFRDPNGNMVDAQQHPGNAPCAAGDDWCASGNTSGEEWADLVANYTAGNFDDDIGAVRQNWVMEIWTAYMMTPSMRFHFGR